MKALRRLLLPFLLRGTETLAVEVPYRAAFVLLPDDLAAWDEERVNHLNALIGEQVGRPVAFLITDRRSTLVLVQIRERLP